MTLSPHAETPAPRRVLVINPNTNPLVTARVRDAAERLAGPHLCFEVVNPESGPFSIESDDDKQQAEVHALALLLHTQTFQKIS